MGEVYDPAFPTGDDDEAAVISTELDTRTETNLASEYPLNLQETSSPKSLDKKEIEESKSLSEENSKTLDKNIESEIKSSIEDILEPLSSTKSRESTTDCKAAEESLPKMRKTRRFSNHSIKEQDCDSNSSKSLKNSADSSNEHDNETKPEAPSKEEHMLENNDSLVDSKRDSDKKQSEDSNSNTSDNQLSDSNSDSSKKKTSRFTKEEDKVPTRRSTRIKSIVEKKGKQQSPKEKASVKKKEKESTLKDELKKDQNKKDTTKKSKNNEKNADKSFEDYCHSPEKKEFLIENTHIEACSFEKDDVNSSVSRDFNDNVANDIQVKNEDLKNEKELKTEDIKKEETKASPEKVEVICSPPSPIPNGTETHENHSVKEEAKPVKVKSRWWRNCEMEQGDAPNSTTSESTPVEQPSPSPSPLDQFSHLKDFPLFEHLDENVYLFERKRSKGKKEVRRMLCDCSLTKEEKERQEPGCGDDCLNRLLMIECGSRCVCGDLCTNKRFQMKKYAPIEPFKTLKKGWGLRAKESIPAGQFVLEYVGEVLDATEFRQRVKFYAKRDGPNAHYYFMALRADEIIDATSRGNLSRFINHSCDPNCETQKWTVNGELRVGFFTTRRVPAGEELTFDYQFQRYGREAQKCFCGASNCRGFIGGDSQVELKSYSKSKDQSSRKKKEKKELEDLIWDEELERLSSGLRNREQTLTLSRLMVRAEDLESRMQLLDILQNTSETGCLRLFLDYHGLSLIWSWMVSGPTSLSLRSKMLTVLRKLPISHKTMLIDSKVLDVVHRWSRDDSSDQGTDDDEGEDKETLRTEITSNASNLMSSWADLKEIFRIPRLEKQKRREDEREVDRKAREYNRRLKEHERSRSRSRERRRSYSPDHRHRSSHDYDHSDHSHRESDFKKRRDYDKYRHNDYSDWKDSPRKSKSYNSSFKRNKYDQKYEEEEHKPKKRSFTSEKQAPSLSKEERRQRFALEVQQKEEEEALRKSFEQEQFQYQMEQQDSYQYSQEVGQEEQFQQEQYEQDQFTPNQSTESFYSYPPPPFDPTMPPPSIDGNHYEYDSSTVYNIPPPGVDGTQLARPPPAPIPASPVQTPQQPPPILPPLNVPPPNFPPPPSNNPLPTDQPPIVYYPPSTSQIPPPALPPPAPAQTLPPHIPPSPQVPLLPPPNSAPPIPVPAAPTTFPPPTYASSQPLLTQQPPPAQPQLPAQPHPPPALPHLPLPQQHPPPGQHPAQMQATSLPQQQPLYYIPPASAEPNALAATILRLATLESSSPVVVPPPPAKLPPNWRTAKDEDGNVYYYHTVTRQTQWDPPSLEQEDHGTPTVDEHRPSRRQRSTTTAAADTSSEVAKKIKELFRTKMSSHIVQCLNPFRKPDCKMGRIISTEDFKHLARKLTHYVMSKELKHCKNVEDLECNENVKHKAKDFVHKYMAKYGDVYRKDKNSGVSPPIQDD